jgi:hypothetical protein
MRRWLDIQALLDLSAANLHDDRLQARRATMIR